MMHRRPLMTCALVPTALFTLGFLRAASADVATMDEYTVTRDGTTIFDDTFGAGKTLAGGAGAVLPSGIVFPGGSPASYLVMGTVTEGGNKAILDSAQGVHVTQTAPFFQTVSLNNATLLTGPASMPFSLTPNVTFSTTGLFDLSVPPTPGGFYQINLSDRVASNMGKGDVISVQVDHCSPALDSECTSDGPFIRLQDANFGNNTRTLIGEAPLDTNHQQIFFELSHPDAANDAIIGSYAYVDNGIAGPLQQLGTYTDLFNDLNYTQAGFVQLAAVPEPSSLALLASSVFGLAWLRRRRANGDRSQIET